MERRQVELLEVRRRDRTVWFLVGLVVGALTLAIVKPWGLGGGAGAGSASVAPLAASTPPASLTPPSPRAAVGPADCFSHTAWRLVTAEQTSGRDIRSWIAIDPVVAIGPSDAALRPVPVVADRLLGIGLCAPPELAAQAGAEGAVILWVPHAREAVTLQLIDLAPLPGFGSGEGQVYAPPAEVAGAGGSWPLGRYLMQLDGEVAHPALWFAFQVSRPPARAPTRSP